MCTGKTSPGTPVGTLFYFPGFRSNPSQGAPEDCSTAMHGSFADLNPKSLHDLGNFGFHVTAK